MSVSHSVSSWIVGAKEGDRDAQQQIWERYYQKLVVRTRSRLAAHNNAVSDEEDVAISVFESFYRAAEAGRFPDLRDRDDLWRLLLGMTIRKTIDHHRKWDKEPERKDLEVIERVVGDGPDPHLTAAAIDEIERLLKLLKDDELRQIAIAKLEGYSNEEIAKKIRRSVSAVERRLRLIRRTWDPDNLFDNAGLCSQIKDRNPIVGSS